MLSKWEKSFYKNQFELHRPFLAQADQSYYAKEAILLLEQIGKPATTILELGAGRGEIANELASHLKDVTTVELVEEIFAYAAKQAHPNVHAMCADFYTVELKETFDVVLYLDGFGVGNDQDQLFLLQRIYNWLKDDGVALIDIYQPLYWQKTAGREMYLFGTKAVQRRYGYEPASQRMTDTWWHTDKPDYKTTQSLACYSPSQIYELCEQAGLEVAAYYPGGAMDFEAGFYKEHVSLEECLSYRIKLKKK